MKEKKNYRRSLLFLWSILLTLSVWAQDGLNVAPYFDGRFNKNPKVVTLLIKGKPLRNYNLTFYKSLTFENDMNVLKEIELHVLSDAKKAVDKETGIKKGRLVYGFYCFPPQKKDRKTLRYLIYRRNEKNTFLVYMEGQATLDDLKNMFKDK